MTSSRESISPYQARFEHRFSQIFRGFESFDTPLLDAMRYSALGGGKRIRPLLVYAAAEAIGTVNYASDDLAAAVECIHVYSLIHDDLPAMDDDQLRRGKATNHIAFDEATAILAGDALQGLAYEVIVKSIHLENAAKLSAIDNLSRCSGVRGMVLGQAIDLHLIATQPSLQQLENMHLHKTATLIEASVLLGALSCGASGIQLDALKHFARTIGLAFQVQDDILDVTADTEVMGKKKGADSERHKPTYVSILGLEAARQKATQLHDEAIEALRIFGERACMLKMLAQFIIDRSY